MSDAESYPVRLTIDYPEKLDRITTLLRPIMILPIFVIISLVSGWFADSDAGITSISGSIFVATALMIVFRQNYPRWWFEFIRELSRFTGRFLSYLFLLTDRYPSTVDEQSYHLEIDYPDAKTDLNRWFPLFKWFLAIPHFVVLVILGIAVVVVTIIAWFAILITGSYPRPVFEFVVGVFRWGARVAGYAFWLVTDRYPPFSLS